MAIRRQRADEHVPSTETSLPQVEDTQPRPACRDARDLHAGQQDADILVRRACQSFPAHSSPGTYCEAEAEAQARVVRACPPYRDDFVYRDGPPTHPWRPIPGYGCAHHVAHVLGISTEPARANCRGGMSVTIDQITEGRTAHPLADAAVNDIWSSGIHSGVITEVDAAVPRVRIDQCGAGGTASTYWETSGQAYR
jgi:hypothetical protein